MTETRALRSAADTARVLVIGSLNVDTILRADAEPPDEGSVLVRDLVTAPGGHAGNCAAALASLGVRVSLVAAVGEDADGEFLIDDLRRAGVDVAGVRRHPGAPTGRVTIPVFGDKHYMLLSRGANDLLTRSEVESALAGRFDAVMLFDPARGALEAVPRAAGGQEGRILCWTPGGVYAGDPVVARLLPACDVLFVNRTEERLAAPYLADPGNAEVVVTLGAQGSLLRHGARRWSVPARPALCLDPTGAGDAFAAAYLLGRLAGLDPEQRLGVANDGGALAVEHVGARPGLSDLLGTPLRSGSRP
jgi:ribokinase